MKRALILLAVTAIGCSTSEPTTSGPESPASARASAAATTATAESTAAPAPENEGAKAVVGQPAPDFRLPVQGGGEMSLSEHAGKIVVLEWFNPECPFVKQAHTKGNLVKMPAELREKGVVWLAINSNYDGSQGSDDETNRQTMKELGMDYPLLRDRDGAVGKIYGAERTPHMYVVDPKGVLVYAGGLDNSMGGDLEDVEKPVNYVADAVAAVQKGEQVLIRSTKAWGCTVKYR